MIERDYSYLFIIEYLILRILENKLIFKLDVTIKYSIINKYK